MRKGLYANIHAKRKRGGKMRKKGAKGAKGKKGKAAKAGKGKKGKGTKSKKAAKKAATKPDTDYASASSSNTNVAKRAPISSAPADVVEVGSDAPTKPRTGWWNRG